MKAMNLERLETEIGVAVDEIKDNAKRYGWTPDSTAWHRAFGEISGLYRALELAKSQRL